MFPGHHSSLPIEVLIPKESEVSFSKCKRVRRTQLYHRNRRCTIHPPLLLVLDYYWILPRIFPLECRKYYYPMTVLMQESTWSPRLWCCSILAGILLVVSVIIVLLWWKRRCTYRTLVQAGLPTVFWRPKFVRYDAQHEEDATTTTTRRTTVNKKLTASTITNILPRMQRLHGPYQMYGTVYGVSTAVIHVAHPVPALALLNQPSGGAVKAPAYNHFKNFCGDGVFTADGEDWRSKRAAVLHALLRCGSGSFYERVQGEAECAVAALTENLDRKIRTVGGWCLPREVMLFLSCSAPPLA